MGATNQIEALKSLLDTEKAALLSGETDAIEECLTRKQKLLDGLDIQRLEPKELADIRLQLKRNHDLIEGAIEGMRAAFHRLQDVQLVSQGLKTYGPEGGIVTHQFRDSRLSRRS